MSAKSFSWKAEWKAAGLDPGSLTQQELEHAEQLKQENQAFLEKHPPEREVEKILQRNRSRKVRKIRLITGSVLPLAAAALIAFFVLPKGSLDSEGWERLKGNQPHPQLMIYRETAGNPEKLTANGIVHPGDILQVAYSVQMAQFGAVLSVDGNQNVTVHLAKDGLAVPLESGKEHPLDFSYELDRAPRFEVFIFLISEKPFEIESAKQILKSTSWDRLTESAFGPSVRWLAFPLKKEVK